LFASYPDAFHLVCEGPEFKIFKVTSNEPFSSRLSLGVVH
jgi:hypothetical protein